jgi:hypothetical protein
MNLQQNMQKRKRETDFWLNHSLTILPLHDSQAKNRFQHINQNAKQQKTRLYSATTEVCHIFQNPKPDIDQLC